jgi:hypothetical protein
MACGGHSDGWRGCTSHTNDTLCSTDVYRGICNTNISTFTNTISAGTVITNTHINELRTSINREYTRRKTKLGSPTTLPSFGSNVVVGEPIIRSYLTALRNAIGVIRSNIVWETSLADQSIL